MAGLELPCLQMQRISAVAQHRHKRVVPARRTRASSIGASIALLVTGPVIAIGVMVAGPADTSVAEEPVAGTGLQLSDLQDERADDFVSRAGIRAGQSAEARFAEDRLTKRLAAERRAAMAARQQARESTLRAVSQADTRLWTTAPLNLWSAAQADATKVGLIESGAKVLVTGRQQMGRVEIVLRGRARWVSSGYLSDERPGRLDPVTAALGGACTNGTAVPTGVSPNICLLYTSPSPRDS